MTNEEILQKSFNKAYKNGWVQNRKDIYEVILEMSKYSDKWKWSQLCLAEIVSHDFAKAFWGEEVWTKPNDSSEYEEVRFNNGIAMKNYEYHLQQIILEKEPLKYLEKFLNDA